MTALSAGSSVTLTLAKNGFVEVASNGGFGSVTITPTGGSAVTENWGPSPFRKRWEGYPEGGSVVLSNASAGSMDYESNATDAPFAVQTMTRTELIALAEADGLVAGRSYMTTDGVLCDALSARFLQPRGPWFVDGRRWSVGAATSATDLTHTYLPPLGPNAQVEIWHQWRMGNVNVTKRGRIYLDGTLGGGVSGAQAVYTRLYNDTNILSNQYTRVQNRNDSASQICNALGDSTPFNNGTSTATTTTVSTNTSKLLRAMGETSKSGSNVTISSITRSGTTATATSTAHGLTTGDFIGVTGATGTGATQYNADPVAVTVTGANTFEYTMASDPGASASGSPVFQRYVDMELVSFRVHIHQGLGF